MRTDTRSSGRLQLSPIQTASPAASGTKARPSRNGPPAARRSWRRRPSHRRLGSGSPGTTVRAGLPIRAPPGFVSTAVDGGLSGAPSDPLGGARLGARLQQGLEPRRSEAVLGDRGDLRELALEVLCGLHIGDRSDCLDLARQRAGERALRAIVDRPVEECRSRGAGPSAARDLARQDILALPQQDVPAADGQTAALQPDASPAVPCRDKGAEIASTSGWSSPRRRRRLWTIFVQPPDTFGSLRHFRIKRFHDQQKSFREYP